MIEISLDDKGVLIGSNNVINDVKTKLPIVVKYKCLLFVTLTLCAMQILPRIGCEQRHTTTTYNKIIFKRSIDTTEKVPRLGKLVKTTKEEIFYYLCIRVVDFECTNIFNLI